MFKAALIISITLLITVGCTSNSDLTTDTKSSDFNSNSEKIEFMERYYTPDFEYNDVVYHIVYHDNSSERSIPGPSDATMIFAFNLDEKELKRIMNKHQNVERFKVNYQKDFLKSLDMWNDDDTMIFLDNGDVIIKERHTLVQLIEMN